MRILVYGAGVLGCELAHVLLQNKKNDVTLLARGEWKERIDQKGLIIRQWAQRKTTVDRVRTIDVLAPEDFYDLVFVVLQAGQLPDVLPGGRPICPANWALQPGWQWHCCSSEFGNLGGNSADGN